MTNDFYDGWFDRTSNERLSASDRSSRAGATVPIDSWTDLEQPSALRKPELAGDPVWATMGGAVAGACGGVLFVCIVWRVDLIGRQGAIALAVLVGAAMGAAFGRLTRRLLRVVPRVALGGFLFGAAWLFAYAFIFRHLMPDPAQPLPFVSSMLGAVAYGGCAGAIPPIRVRPELGRRV